MNGIFDSSWEKGRENEVGGEPHIPIRIPKRWPVERIYQVLVVGKQQVQREILIWLN